MSLQIEQRVSGVRLLLEESLDLLDLHQLNPARYPFFLESQRHVTIQSRYDILFAFPGEKIEADGLKNACFFDQLSERFDAHTTHKADTGELPFYSGWFVYLSYELLGVIEPTLAYIGIEPSLPNAQAVKIPAAIIKDNHEKKCWLVSEKGEEHLIPEMLTDIAQCVSTENINADQVLYEQEISDSDINEEPWANLIEDSPQEFLSAVDKIKCYLKEGDTFQVNLSRQYRGELKKSVDYLAVYRSMRQHNPAPFSGLACIGNSVICSASPERLVRSKGGLVEMRPIAGTRPRDTDAVEDSRLANELLENRKENAEHIMLLDLIRNDLGRICETGTICLDEKMQLESYATVHHIVSNISGKLRLGIKPADIIRAVFPGGTITGCPKVRCMEIIHELERLPRGAYTGSMGYINQTGDMDLNILIRTMVIQGKTIHFRTGAGIVADSIAAHELAETRHKAKGMFNTLKLHDE